MKQEFKHLIPGALCVILHHEEPTLLPLIERSFGFGSLHKGPLGIRIELQKNSSLVYEDADIGPPFGMFPDTGDLVFLLNGVSAEPAVHNNLFFYHFKTKLLFRTAIVPRFQLATAR